MDVKPTPGYILVKPKKQEKQLASGIYLPDQTDEKPQVAKVISIGISTKEEGRPCQRGDTIIYKKWGGNEVKLSVTDKEELLFIEFKDVLAIITGEKKHA